MESILRRRQVEELTGLKRSSLYRLMAGGEFPTQVKLTSSKKPPVGWYASDIDAWLRARKGAPSTPIPRTGRGRPAVQARTRAVRVGVPA